MGDGFPHAWGTVPRKRGGGPPTRGTPSPKQRGRGPPRVVPPPPKTRGTPPRASNVPSEMFASISFSNSMFHKNNQETKPSAKMSKQHGEWKRLFMIVPLWRGNGDARFPSVTESLPKRGFPPHIFRCLRSQIAFVFFKTSTFYARLQKTTNLRSFLKCKTRGMS